MSKYFFLFAFACLLISSCSPGRFSTQLPAENFPAFRPAAPTSTSPQASSLSTQMNIAPSQNPDDGKKLLERVVIAYEKAGSIWLYKTNIAEQMTNGGNDTRPNLSPSGDKFVFVRHDGLWICSLEDNQPAMLFSKTGFTPWQFIFSKTGDFIYFSTKTINGEPQYDFYRISLKSRSVEQLLDSGSGGYFVENPVNSFLVLSRPGKILLFDPVNKQSRELFTFTPKSNLDIPPITWINSGYGFYTVLPALRSDMHRYMYFTAKGEIPAQLAEFSTTSANMQDAYISPNGMYLVYVKLNNAQNELHIIDASTTDKKIIQSGSSQLKLLGWSPESDRFIFSIDGASVQWNAMDGSLLSIGSNPTVTRILWVNKDILLLQDASQLNAIITGHEYIKIDNDIQGEFDAVILQ
jgi:Tol biopolymer transport system component